MRAVGFPVHRNDTLFFEALDVVVYHRAAQIRTFGYLVLTGTRLIVDGKKQGQTPEIFGGCQVFRMKW